MMDTKVKLHLALIQTHNMLNLLKGNQYENYMCGKLYGVKYELERQTKCLRAKKEGSGGQLSEVST